MGLFPLGESMAFAFASKGSLVWLLLRTGTRPSRIAYPCQQAAAANASLLVLPGLLVGLLVSIFQSATSINEMTLTFIPKMLAVACAILFFLPWMMQTMLTFTTNLLNNIVIYIR